MSIIFVAICSKNELIYCCHQASTIIFNNRIHILLYITLQHLELLNIKTRGSPEHASLTWLYQH